MTRSSGGAVRKGEDCDGVRDCRRSLMTAKEQWIDEDVDLLARVFFSGVNDEQRRRGADS